MKLFEKFNGLFESLAIVAGIGFMGLFGPKDKNPRFYVPEEKAPEAGDVRHTGDFRKVLISDSLNAAYTNANIVASVETKTQKEAFIADLFEKIYNHQAGGFSAVSGGEFENLEAKVKESQHEMRIRLCKLVTARPDLTMRKLDELRHSIEDISLEAIEGSNKTATQLLAAADANLSILEQKLDRAGFSKAGGR